MKNKIFGIGLSRTGTNSLCYAMKGLGFKTKHFPINMQQIRNNDFNNDITVSGRFKELDKLFPNSKFIMTQRNIDDWAVSCFNFFRRKNRNTKFNNWVLKSFKSIYNCGPEKVAKLSLENYKNQYIIFEKQVRKYFSGRKNDILFINIINDNNPYTKLVSFLENNDLLNFPHKNIFKNNKKADKSEKTFAIIVDK
ncbi:MAG: sulfotransferase [Atribacterota bacterium]